MAIVEWQRLTEWRNGRVRTTALHYRALVKRMKTNQDRRA